MALSADKNQTVVSVIVTVMVILVMVMAIPGAAWTVVNPPSVHYISRKSGNFLVAEEMAFATENAFATLPAPNTCSCKSLCDMRAGCAAWSHVVLEDAAECRLAETGPLNYTVFSQTSATYGFLESSVAGEYDIREDGLLYLKPPMKLLYEAAKAFCASIPGHRLGMYKTIQQFNMLEEYWCFPESCPTTIHIGLEKNGSDIRFIDGTPFADTEISKQPYVSNNNDPWSTFTIYSKKLDDDPVKHMRNFLCQANPLGVEW